MTDNEIIKDLKAVVDWFTAHGSNTNTAVIDISRRAIDVIERQKAEDKKLMDMVGQNEGVLPEYEKLIKSEVIKAFAERLKNKSELLAPSVYAEPFRAVSVEEIDNIVAEMKERF